MFLRFFASKKGNLLTILDKIQNREIFFTIF